MYQNMQGQPAGDNNGNPNGEPAGDSDPEIVVE